MASVRVYGCGAWGQNIIASLQSIESEVNFELESIVHQGNSNRAAQVSSEFGLQTVSVQDEPESLPDAVIIATPDETHDDLVKRFLSQDVDVFVEKPLATRVADALDLIEQANQSEGSLFVGHLMMYHPVVDELVERLPSNSTGDSFIQVRRFNDYQLINGKRILTTSLIHDLCILDGLYKSIPSVHTTQVRRGEAGLIRYIDCWLEYPGGATVHLSSGCDCPVKRRDFMVRAEQFYHFNGLEDQLSIWNNNQSDGDPNEIISSDSPPLKRELADFMEQVVQSDKTRIPVETQHVYRVMRSIGAIRRSVGGSITPGNDG